MLSFCLIIYLIILLYSSFFFFLQIFSFLKDNISCKSGRGIVETLKIKGWANLPSDFRLYFQIKDEEKPIIKEKYTYLSFQKNKLRNPNLFKLAKKMKLQTLNGINPNYYQIDAENLITIIEINKRADIFAKLFMKFNLEETLERQNKEEEEKLKKEEEAKTIQEEVLLSIEFDSEDQKKINMSESYAKTHKNAGNEQETNQSLRIIDEDEEDSEAEIKERKKEEELSPKRINDLLLKKRLEVATNMTIAEMKKIAEINKNYQEIIEYFDEKVLHCFQTEKYEECIFYKEKKEEFVKNIVQHVDYDSLLRTLIIYKLNNNIL